MLRADIRFIALARLFATAGAVALAGCEDTLARRDGISPAAADAVAYNIAVQTIDPWPAHAFELRSQTNGARLASTMERYRSGGAVSAPVDNGGGKAAPAVFAPVSTGGQ